MYLRIEPAAGDAFGAAIAKELAAQVVEVWPENWPAFQLFQDVSTQWRVGMGGATGLDYLALYPLIDRQTSTTDEWRELFDDVRALEVWALEAMQEK